MFPLLLLGLGLAFTLLSVGGMLYYLAEARPYRKRQAHGRIVRPNSQLSEVDYEPPAGPFIQKASLCIVGCIFGIMVCLLAWFLS